MRCRFLLCVLTLLLVSVSSTSAEDTTFVLPIRADYELNVLGGTSLNPGPDTGYLPFRAQGDMTFVLDASLNNPAMPTTVPFLSVTAQLTGLPPSPPAFLPHILSPNVAFFGGNLTNIVRDAAGEVTSADVDNLQMQWELLGQGPLTGIRLETGGSLVDPTSNIPFFGSIHAIPFALGDVIQGPDAGNSFNKDFEVFRTDDPANPMELVAYGRKRTLTVVPEPSGGMLSILLGVGSAALRRRRLEF